MAAQLVLLLLLAVPLSAFTANVYYVVPDDAAGQEQSCPPHLICHNISYYSFQPEYFFTSDTIIIFLEGQHSFDREDLVQVNNVHNLTLKGQGEWPIVGPEETVMQSNVIINCTRGRGGFIFDTGYDNTIEGLTITNCGQDSLGVFRFAYVQGIIFFLKNSLQFIAGNGLATIDCDYVIITNCSFYGTASHSYGRGLSSDYHSLHKKVFSSYTLWFTYSNMTNLNSYGKGGGIQLSTNIYKGKEISTNVVFFHLVLSHNNASNGGGLSAEINYNTSIQILNSKFFHNVATGNVGGALIKMKTRDTSVTIKNTNFIENSYITVEAKFADKKPKTSELLVSCSNDRL